MSEIKTNAPAKQEGDFKIKSKPTKPKQLGNKKQEIIKVSIKEPLVEIPNDVIKVTIPNEPVKKEETDAIQIGETKTVDVGEQAGDGKVVDIGGDKPLQSPARLLKKLPRWKKSKYNNQ